MDLYVIVLGYVLNGTLCQCKKLKMQCQANWCSRNMGAYEIHSFQILAGLSAIMAENFCGLR
jgi:hypothetical protein